MRKHKVLAAAVCLTMVITQVVPVMADTPSAQGAADVSTGGSSSAQSFVDMPGNWATTSLENAVANGLLSGYDTNAGKEIRPNGSLTRAELAAVVNRAFGAEEKASLSGVTDVASDAWYAEDVAKAIQMGTLAKDTKMRPDDKVTRQEAAAILARAFKLDGGGDKGLSQFADQGSVASWAKADLAAMVTAGYISGSDGKVNPAAGITRAEFAKIMDNMVKQYIKTSGEITQVASGNVMIDVPGVTLKGVTITGDLVIGDGVANGDAVLDGVKVNGRLIARGGGANSVIIKGDSQVPTLILAKTGSQLHIKAEGNAKITSTVVAEGSGDVIVSGKIGNLNVNAESVKVEAQGAEIGTATIAGGGASLTIDKDSKAETVAVAEAAAKSSVTVSGEVNKMTSAAPQSSIAVAQGGNVKTMEVAKTAESTKVDVQKGATVDSITTEAPKSDVAVSGTVNKVEAAASATGTNVEVAKDAKVTELKADTNVTTSGDGKASSTTGTGTVTDKETGKSETPSGGGSSSGGSSSGGGGSHGGGSTEISVAISDVTVKNETEVVMTLASAIEGISAENFKVGGATPSAISGTNPYTLTFPAGTFSETEIKDITFSKSGYKTQTAKAVLLKTISPTVRGTGPAPAGDLTGSSQGGETDAYNYETDYDAMGVTVAGSANEVTVTIPSSFNADGMRALVRQTGNKDHGAADATAYVGIGLRPKSEETDYAKFDIFTTMDDLSKATSADAMTLSGNFDNVNGQRPIQYVSVAAGSGDAWTAVTTPAEAVRYYVWFDQNGDVTGYSKLTIKKAAGPAQEGSSAETEAVEAVKDAKDVTTLKAALESPALGLDLTDFNKLTEAQKTTVMKQMLAEASGYVNKAAIQSALNAKITNLKELTSAFKANLDFPAGVTAGEVVVTYDGETPVYSFSLSGKTACQAAPASIADFDAAFTLVSFKEDADQYACANLKNFIPDAGPYTIKQTNNAMSVYRDETLEDSKIVNSNGTYTKNKDGYTQAGNYEFLIKDGCADITIEMIDSSSNVVKRVVIANGVEVSSKWDTTGSKALTVEFLDTEMVKGIPYMTYTLKKDGGTEFPITKDNVARAARRGAGNELIQYRFIGPSDPQGKHTIQIVDKAAGASAHEKGWSVKTETRGTWYFWTEDGTCYEAVFPEAAALDVTEESTENAGWISFILKNGEDAFPLNLDKIGAMGYVKSGEDTYHAYELVEHQELDCPAEGADSAGKFCMTQSASEGHDTYLTMAKGDKAVTATFYFYDKKGGCYSAEVTIPAKQVSEPE